VGRVIQSFEFRDDAGFEYHFDLGRNDEERRVIALYMRLAGGKTWLPVIEMDIDVESYFKEKPTNMPPPGTKDDRNGNRL
jgi:hypothetical protein